MSRILEVNVDDNGHGGVYAFFLNVLENINPKYKLDICTFEKFEKESNIKYIESFGGSVIYCGYKGNLFLKQYNSLKNLYTLVKKKGYHTVHIHSDVSYKLFLYGLMAKLGGCSNILLHSHSTRVDGKHRRLKYVLHMSFRYLLGLVGNKFLACSDLAAHWMYPKFFVNSDKVFLIKNGINLEKFRFNEQTRTEYRKKLGIENDFVVGHVGRFSYLKNQEFLVDIFNEILKHISNSKLLLVGNYVLDSNYYDLTVKKIRDYGIEDKVEFLGLREDVNLLMSAMDCFVLPSRYEGLPIVGIEAQAIGLPCFFSDTITRELAITNLCHFLPEGKEYKIWAKNIIQAKGRLRANTYNIMKNSGFDMNSEVKRLEKFYHYK